MIFLFIRPRVVGSRGPHKTKVHVISTFSIGSPYHRPLCRLFLNVSLLFEINKAKGVVFKNGGKARGELSKDIELIYPGGAQPEKPYFGFKLPCLCHRFVTGGLAGNGLWVVVKHTKYCSLGRGLGGVNPDWRVVNGEDICRAIIEPISTDKGEEHVKESIVAVKMEGTGSSVFVPGHHPGDEDIA